jgi:hypothetical protein
MARKRRPENPVREILEVEEKQLHVLREIEKELHPQHNNVTHFIIKEIFMALTPVAPGFSPVYTATIVPAGNILNPAQPVPVWTSSDPKAPVTADATGLVATVTVAADAAVGEQFTLTITYLNADGTTATGTLDQTIVAAPATDVTSFSISQTA